VKESKTNRIVLTRSFDSASLCSKLARILRLRVGIRRTLLLEIHAVPFSDHKPFSSPSRSIVTGNAGREGMPEGMVRQVLTCARCRRPRYEANTPSFFRRRGTRSNTCRRHRPSALEASCRARIPYPEASPYRRRRQAQQFKKERSPKATSEASLRPVVRVIARSQKCRTRRSHRAEDQRNHE
jgi:hypothetical protein